MNGSAFAQGLRAVMQMISLTKPGCAHWSQVAHNWQHWEPPLRPCPADIQVIEEFVRKWHAPPNRGPFKALLWGVTPEIAEMAWPERTELLAVDRSEQMIECVWPGDIDGRRKALCANWLDFPVGSGEYGAVVGDGVFTLLSFPDEYRALAAQAHRILEETGILVTRLFVQPDQFESPDVVLADVRSGCIGNPHIFKFRLAMALQSNAASGVRMGDVFDAWNEARGAREDLIASTGWSSEAISTIEHYRNKNSRLSFPTLSEFHAVFEDFFEPIDCCVGNYEMGDRCPIVCYRARG